MILSNHPKGIFILLLFLSFSFMGWAQKGLAVAPFFDGRYKKSDKSNEVIIKNDELKQYNMPLFHSIQLENMPNDFDLIIDALREDEKKAIKSQIINNKGELVSSFLQFPAINKKSANRFVIFNRNGAVRVTLIYIEIDASLDQLVKIFVTKK